MGCGLAVGNGGDECDEFGWIYMCVGGSGLGVVVAWGKFLEKGLAVMTEWDCSQPAP